MAAQSTQRIEWKNLPSQNNLLAERNDVLRRLRKYNGAVMTMLLADDDFQEGLGVLDPEDRRFIASKSVRRLVALGLISKMEFAASID